MKNGLDNVDGDVQPPPAKRIKLEEDPTEEGRLLSQKRQRRGGQRKLSKSTIEERALVLLNDDRISAVEPQQVLCRMCGHWVKLFKHTDYSPANWRTHADKCESRSGWKARIQEDPGLIFSLTVPAPINSTRNSPAAESVSAPPIVASHSLTDSSSGSAKSIHDNPTHKDSKGLLDAVAPFPSPTRRPLKSTAERRLEVENDPRCENEGPHSVLCKMCGQSVRLHNTREYDLWNWHRHAEKCEIRTGWLKSDAATSHTTITSSGIPTRSVGLSPGSSSAGGRSGVARATRVPGMRNRQVEKPILRSERLHDRDSRSDAIMPTTASVSIRQRGRSGNKLISMRGRGAQKISTRPDTSASESSANPHVIDESRGEETQVQECEVAFHAREDMANTTHPGDSGTNVQLIASRHVAPFIKAEPDDSDELLYPIPDPKSEEDSNPTSISAGAKRRKGRTAEERRQALIDDPRVGQVLPNEVFCKMCNKWIKLYKEVDYVESNWTRHAERCGLRLAAKNAVTTVLPTPPSSTVSGPSSVPMKRSPVKSTEERLRDLQADRRIEAIEPHQVLCSICKQWIKLQSYREYDIWNWRKHVPLCEQRHTGTNEGPSITSPSLPSIQHGSPSRSELKRSLRTIKAEDNEDEPPTSATTAHLTATPKFSSAVKVKDESTAEDRRAVLERDGRCENIEPQRVTCKLCSRVVGLHVKKDYSLSNWYKHIASCDKQTQKPVKPVIKTPLAAIGVTLRSAASATAPPIPETVAAGASKEVEAKSSEDAARNRDIDVQFLSAPPHTAKAIKSTAEDRRAKLLADKRVDTVEPNRIKCKLCQHWLKLNEFMSYAPYNWYKHIERCEARTSMKDHGTSGVPIPVKEEEPEVQEVNRVLEEIKVFEEPSISTASASRKRTTPAERLTRMQADSRIKTIEKHRARCGLCDKWVKLQNKTEYDPHNWFAHIKKCAIRSNVSQDPEANTSISIRIQEMSPSITVDSDTAMGVSERVDNTTVTNRRALLLNDPRSAAVEPQRVLCAICQQWIKLREGKDYVPYNWFKHKRKCERRHGLSQTNTLLNEGGAPISSPVKVVVKKEPVSVDLDLYNTDQRKMSDAEREAQLRADPRIGDVEPGRVFCRMCENWIKLNMATGFLRGNWLRHAQRCRGRISWQGATPEGTEEPPELSAVEVIDLESTGGHFGYIELGRLIGKFEPTVSSTDFGNPGEVKPTPDAAKQQQPRTWSMPTLRARPNSSRVNSPAPLTQPQNELKAVESGKRMHRSEEERKQELEADPRTKIVLPDKILCKMCDHWIQMRRDVSYSPQNWLKHAGICEQKTGWLKRHKSEGQDDAKSAPNVMEEFIPYNARVRAEQKQFDFDPPSLKPVDWGQFVPTDDEDDEVMGRRTAIKAGADASPSGKTSAEYASGQTLLPANINVERSNKNDVPPNAVAAPKMSVPTPLAAIRANKGDLKAAPVATHATMGPGKPTSTSPPVVAPFTTVPLQFYRAAYPSHVMQTGFSATKDGTPPKSVSPQNGGAQRTLPFVVPGPSMLPHLLPRPVLVPISHTSRQAAGPASPFRLPSTPPGPPVVLSKTNGTQPTAPSTALANVGSAGGASHSTSVPPTQRAEATGVAVPTPIRSVIGQNTLIAPVETDQAHTAPASQAKLAPGQKPDHRPQDSGGVLQLHPVEGKPSHEATVKLVETTTATTPAAASGKTYSGVLKFASRSDAPLDAPPPPPMEKITPAPNMAKETISATISPDGILQLGPRADMPVSAPAPAPVEMEKTRTTLSDKREPPVPAPSQPQQTSNVLRLGPKTGLPVGQVATDGPYNVVPSTHADAFRETVHPDDDEDVTMLDEVPNKDVALSSEPLKDTMLVEA